MNYLAHFVYNHQIRELTPQPYFVLGVALPDLWTWFSRRRRIRWKAVRAAAKLDPIDTQLQAGLLNHVEADRRFHTLPSFLHWLRELKDHAGDTEQPLVLDFLAHLVIELTLDHHLVRSQPHLPEQFYTTLEACDLADAEQRISTLAQVDATGLQQVAQGFLSRRFLHRYSERQGLLTVIKRVLDLTTIPACPPVQLINALLDHAAEIVSPAAVWADFTEGE
ncbi:MAG: hypothetical protein ABIG44_18100 [Planctomycetota bacterium]